MSCLFNRIAIALLVQLTFCLAGCGNEEPPNPQCTFGQDQTCNDSPIISSIHGACNEDGTCTCNEGFDKNPETGKCL